MRTSILAAAASVLFGALAVNAVAEDRVLTLPENYQTTFEKYLIADRMLNEDQVIAVYADAKTRAAARAGEPIPDGTVIVAELYKAKLDEDGEVAESLIGRRIPEKLAAIVTMERRAEWAEQYPDDLKVGGWEFEVFSPTGENLGKDTTACRECHQPLADSEFLYTYDLMAGAN